MTFLYLFLLPLSGYGSLLERHLKAHEKPEVSNLKNPSVLNTQLKMPVAVGPYGQTQPSCFDRVKMGFMMGFAVGMAAGAMFGTFSCLRIGMRGRELMGGVGKTMMQSGGTFGTFMAIGMGIRC
ncbi:reactive oxygen species modulator 1 [Neolamprologus brichardi]|uniref:Reactive oxygen species modulator 1 n=1 Tax=Neolamprologus brichardi TaxID=32507 RepID=A0A3Q4HC26_NEOBR|nr:reactive oxygen species modulator 1 [Neolamprologus brichardi]